MNFDLLSVKGKFFFSLILFWNKLYLNLLVYDQNIFGSSLKVFGNLRKSPGIFGNFQKMSENVHLAFGRILENLW